MKTITIRFSPVMASIAEDGSELTKEPYPFHVTEGGHIGRQDFWKGRPQMLVGFQDLIDVLKVDLPWAEFWRYPQTAVGKYAVTADTDGTMNTCLVAIESVHESDS